MLRCSLTSPDCKKSQVFVLKNQSHNLKYNTYSLFCQNNPITSYSYLSGPKCFSNASLVSTLATFAKEKSRRSGNFANAAFCNIQKIKLQGVDGITAATHFKIPMTKQESKYIHILQNM
jgi:hypothetical protein